MHVYVGVPDKVRARAQQVRSELRGAHSVLLLRFQLANLLSALLPLTTVRAALYRAIGLGIGPGVSFTGPITIIGSGRGIYEHLSIGENSNIGLKPIFNLDGRITLGRNVSLSPFVVIYTSTHLLGPGSRRRNPTVITRPVVIEDGAWVGIGCIILPGVVIGRGSVISAGSVVTESIPPNTLAAGNPAKPVQELPWPHD